VATNPTKTSVHGTPQSAARLKRRHAAETRMKAYGILAIALAFLALLTLLWTVIGKAGLALTESYVTLPVTLEAGLDPATTDFNALAQTSLQAQFPSASGRDAKKAMKDVLSGEAGIDLQKRVAADPGLIGTTFDQKFLASDLTDLYLKGEYGSLGENSAKGNLTLSIGDDVVGLVSSEEDFIEAVIAAKAALGPQAQALTDKADAQERGRVEFERRATEATDETARTKAADEAAKRAAKRDEYMAQVAEIERRIAETDLAEPLTEDSPSQIVRIDDVWIKLTEVGAHTASGISLGAAPRAGVFATGEWHHFVNEIPQSARKLTDQQIVWIEKLRENGMVSSQFNTRFFTAGDSREPELAGIWGAVVGSFWTMLVTFLLSFPVGMLAAIYLEEYAPKSRLTDFIEVNVNNLAAVPSIIYGLLGLAVFIGFFGVPRSAPLAGGIVMALMTLPTIIIAARAAIRAVPPSIRDAALGVGASKLQTSFHHVLPLAMPGILTGTIIGLARALGETAPLIMIGMVAFIVDIPRGVTDSATVMPVQIYRWSDFPERAFEARTAAAIVVLLVFLILMNAVAVFLRSRFERRW
jgi:phosphate transport system permease protein